LSIHPHLRDARQLANPIRRVRQRPAPLAS
jgi:hypothetical protein